MALIKGKYQRLTVDLEKSEYRRLVNYCRDRGWSVAYLLRMLIAGTINQTATLPNPVRITIVPPEVQ